MPESVAIIGAGVVGLACATVLQMRGHPVTLIDPNPPGEGCSFGNAGCLSRASCVPLGLPGAWRNVPGWLIDPAAPFTIAPRYAIKVAPWLRQLQRSSTIERVNEIADALHPLLTCTIDRWRPLAQRARVPELIVQNGYAFAYESEKGFNSDALGRELRSMRGVAIEVLTDDAVRDFEPTLSSACTHLVVLPEQGHCPNPLRLSRALANTLREAGARFVAQRVTGFENVDGRVSRVTIDSGVVDANVVVVAAGAHSKPLAEALGTVVPLETERGYHAMLATPSISPRMPIGSGEGKYIATPMEEGLRIAGTVELAGLDALPDYRRADVLIAAAQRLFPGLSQTTVTRWMGHRPSLPDSLPVIARSPKFRNAYFAFGHGHVGLTAAAPTAHLIADLIVGREPFMSVAPFSPERFA
ncbi:MAG TPA: FAD-dependent oxidoreductase [Casimicrobiaceae bacterium]|nr:FAD-dependent oxidoreductase [Casimicrobiaceae bacterium]